MLFVMYGSSALSSVFAVTERSEMGLYDVPMFMSWFQRLQPARGGTDQKKILHLANWSQLIHPGPALSLTKIFWCRVRHACQR